MQFSSKVVASSKRLVVVRAGDNSLHHGWSADGVQPSYDLGVSSFGKAIAEAGGSHAFYHHSLGGKWEGIFQFFSAHPRLLDSYDWFWLPDDDLITTSADINLMFDIAEAYNLELAQPSLSWKSYYSHFITLHNTRFKLRYTTFVEVMMPLFSAAMLRRALPAFEARRFGWGFDLVWPRLLPDPGGRVAIIDAVAVDHLRPVKSGTLYKASENSPDKEMRAILAEYGIVDEKFIRIISAGVDINGRRLERGLRLWANIYLGWNGLRFHNSPQAPRNFRRVARNIARCIFIDAADYRLGFKPV
jgi:hypothetical protein